MLLRNRTFKGQLLAAALLVVSTSCPYSVRAACQGDSCPDEHASAKEAGLLGATTCNPRSYPLSGTKQQPVRYLGDLCFGTSMLELIKQEAVWPVGNWLESLKFGPLQQTLQGPILDLRWAGSEHEMDKVWPAAVVVTT